MSYLHQCGLNFLFSTILRPCHVLCWKSWASPEGLSFFICKIRVLDDITSRFPFSSWIPLFGLLNKPVGFPSGSVGKESAWNAGDPCSIPGSERSTGERIGYPLQYSWASLVAQLVKNLTAMWIKYFNVYLLYYILLFKL